MEIVMGNRNQSLDCAPRKGYPLALSESITSEISFPFALRLFDYVITLLLWVHLANCCELFL